jgi:hypothetical protein
MLNVAQKPKFLCGHFGHLANVIALLAACWICPKKSVSADDRLEFFESKIRPVLIEHCLECHSLETEASGGLLLDSRTGWLAGGDSGAAIVPGNVAESRLLTALTYENPKLQMPPEGQLSPTIVNDFRRWIDAGASDPRESPRPPSKKQVGLLVEQAQEHWAYRDIQQVSVPVASESGSSSDANSPVDAFINQRLAESSLQAAPTARPDVLVRRLYFDLWGLPPTPEELQQTLDLLEQNQLGYEHVVDQLLRSAHFGEHFARKWMDVARYGDSITLRGFVLPVAWRYRDYLVDAFNRDQPFDQMIREQVAGDLLPSSDLTQQQRQLIATGFLVLGNTNLETQDKTQLEMDYIDEQLEVIGRAFLGQTIGCARCHDHKFDPIPIRDYYALAGIMRSAVSLEHENVSKWIERPLPLPQEENRAYEQLEVELAELKQEIAKLTQHANKSSGKSTKAIYSTDLPGVVVDDTKAKLVGKWIQSTSVGPYIEAGYLHDDNRAKGQMTATFEPEALEPGQYEVRLAYSPGSNRASNALVRVFSADGESTRRINQTQAPDIQNAFVSLGKYRFEKDGQAFVLINNEDSDGVVIVDAVQFLPQTAPELATKGLANAKAAAGAPAPGRSTDPNTPSKPTGSVVDDQPLQTEQLKQNEQRLKKLETRRRALEGQLAERPKFLTLYEANPPQNIPIHIRGDVHNLGEVVPRGFLTALQHRETPAISADSSGRREFAEWLSAASNPLTARVYANRVWSWLMGQGLVASINNFGTTGSEPTHPELLDWLSIELIRNGWSTKHLVRTIVLSDAYRRQIVQPDEQQLALDPNNTLYWSGHARRLSAEALRDAMLRISGELDTTLGGSTIRENTKDDYNYEHQATRRSIYQPVFRNSLPELYEQFDFADSSMSIGQRSRSTVPTQALVLLNHPWVAQRVTAATARLREKYTSDDARQLLHAAYLECLSRPPTPLELDSCLAFLSASDAEQVSADVESIDRFRIIVHSLLASLDFRYLD